MSDAPLPPGKLPAELLRELLQPRRPLPADLLLPPTVGEDAGVIALKGGALVVATDPITLTGRTIGSHAVTINANDVAVMGARPRWFLAVLLLPQGTTEGDLRALFADMRGALEQLDAELIGGHSEITAAVSQPVVVGQMLGFREDGGFVRTGGMQSGDQVMQVGPAPVEGAAVLAAEAANRLGDLDPALLAEARDAIRHPGISVVEAALLATDLGASALHDPTEGGLSAGLHELAEASSLALEIEEKAVLWFEPGRAICRRLGADPWGILASGTLLATFPADRAETALEVLGEAGFAASLIGQVRPGAAEVRLNGQPLARYQQDEVSRLLAT